MTKFIQRFFDLVRWLLILLFSGYAVMLIIAVMAMGTAGHRTIDGMILILAVVGLVLMSIGLIISPRLIVRQHKIDRLILWSTATGLLGMLVFVIINLINSDDDIGLKAALTTVIGLILCTLLRIVNRILRI